MASAALWRAAAPVRGSGRGPALAALLGLAALLPGCAAPPPPAATGLSAPLSYPPSTRQRILRIALAEWQDWGRVVIDPGQPAQAAGRPLAEPAEGALQNFPRVLAYWRATPDGEAAITRNRARYAAALAHPGTPEGLWSEPAWSAAFISYVMRGAGLDQREFPPSAAHAFYIDAMLADAAAFPATAPFVPRDWTGYAPQPGDLVCADRSPQPLRHWRDRLGEAGIFRPMHCDIVVAAGEGLVQAIGGNVGDAVTLSRFPADAAGRLLPRPAPGPSGGPAWFAVFENRLGRLPPWDQPGQSPPWNGSPAS